jgi:hypothetical protein
LLGDQTFGRKKTNDFAYKKYSYLTQKKGGGQKRKEKKKPKKLFLAFSPHIHQKNLAPLNLNLATSYKKKTLTTAFLLL